MSDRIEPKKEEDEVEEYPRESSESEEDASNDSLDDSSKTLIPEESQENPLMETEAGNQEDVPKYVVEENPRKSSESSESQEDSSNDSSEELNTEEVSKFQKDLQDLQVCNFKYQNFSFKLLFATFLLKNE